MRKVYLIVELCERYNSPVFADTLADAQAGALKEGCFTISEAHREDVFPFEVLPTGKLWRFNIGGWREEMYQCPCCDGEVHKYH